MILYVEDKNHCYNFQEDEKKKKFINNLKNEFKFISCINSSYGGSSSFSDFEIIFIDGVDDHGIKKIINEIQMKFSGYQFYTVDKHNNKRYYKNYNIINNKPKMEIFEAIATILVVIIVIKILFI